MPRLPEFNRTEVLNAALGIFIKDGYEASSINKLLDAMEINRGSLYASFGDKETLFREVMSTYVGNLGNLTTSTLIATKNPIKAIEAFFNSIFIFGGAGALDKGCLLFNTVSELAHTNRPLAQEAKDYILMIRDLLCKRLQEAKDKGLIAQDVDISAQADILVATMAGLRLLGKMDASKEQLQNVINAAMMGLK